MQVAIKGNCLSYLAWEWCLRSNDLQRGKVPFPCLLSPTLSSAGVAAATVPWFGEGWVGGTA